MRKYEDYNFDPEWDEIIPAETWNNPDYPKCSDWGCGYWMKDGKRSRDEVFSTPQEDATHVLWLNK